MCEAFCVAASLFALYKMTSMPTNATVWTIFAIFASALKERSTKQPSPMKRPDSCSTDL